MDDEAFDETLEDIEGLPSTEPQYVYVMYAEGTRWIKIGLATDVETRRRDLQVGCPPLLRILFATPYENASALEELLHAHFAAYALQGEWFTLPEDVPTVLDLLAFIYKHFQPKITFNGPLSKLQKVTVMEQAVLDAFNQKSPLGIRGLMDVVGAAPSQYGYVRKMLTALCKRGEVVRVRYGKYCRRGQEGSVEETLWGQM